MDDTVLLFRPPHGRGHQSAVFVPKYLDTLRAPRAGLSSSVDTQHRYDKSSAPSSDVEATEEQISLPRP